MKVLIIALRVSKPYLGTSAVANNKLRGFVKIDKELEKEGVKITFLSINDEIRRKVEIMLFFKIFMVLVFTKSKNWNGR